MNIEELQTQVANLIRNDAAFAGIPLVVDEGQFPQLPERETALRTHGLFIAVLLPECIDVTDDAPEGTFLYVAGCPIIVEENVSKNRSVPGRPTISKVKRLLKDCLQGQLSDLSPDTGLKPVDPWFRHLGRVNGVQRLVVMLSRQFA